MHSFLLNRRLYLLSRALVRHNFSISVNNYTREAVNQSHLQLYSDMLQYHMEHPEYGYREIYSRFVDDDAKEMLAQRHHLALLLGVAACCIVLVIVGFITLDWVAAYILKNIPISYTKM